MKIHTRIVFDIASGLVVEDECFEYSGPVALCDGGPGAGEGGYGTGSPGQGEGVVSDEGNSGSGGATGDSSGGAAGDSGGASAGDSGGISEGWGPPGAYTGITAPAPTSSFALSPEQESMVNNARDMGYFDSPFGPPENITENSYDMGYLESDFDIGRSMMDNAQNYGEFGLEAFDPTAPYGFLENFAHYGKKGLAAAPGFFLGIAAPELSVPYELAIAPGIRAALNAVDEPGWFEQDLAKSMNPESTFSRSVAQAVDDSKQTLGQRAENEYGRTWTTTPVGIAASVLGAKTGIPGAASLAGSIASRAVGKAYDEARENAVASRTTTPENQSTVRGGVLDDIANTLADKSNPNLGNAIASAQGRPSPVEEYSPFSYPQDFWQA